MKKIIILVLMVTMIFAFSTTAFAASYSGYFYNGYTTNATVNISNNGQIHMVNNLAQYFDGYYKNGASFKTTALYNWSPYESKQTFGGTDYVFDWYQSQGTGRLEFDNDYKPWTSYQLHNTGNFY